MYVIGKPSGRDLEKCGLRDDDGLLLIRRQNTHLREM
jgi:hypothetical protein